MPYSVELAVCPDVYVEDVIEGYNAYVEEFEYNGEDVDGIATFVFEYMEELKKFLVEVYEVEVEELDNFMKGVVVC